MDIRNRMSDIKILKSRICQDYLKMILNDDWQKALYNEASKHVNDNHHRDKYIEIWKAMRDKGPENFMVEDMDVSSICMIIKYVGNVHKEVNRSVRNSLELVKNGRNQEGHSSGNEETEDLYGFANHELYNLQAFVNAVDSDETIGDDKRLAFRQKYISEIKKLQKTVDSERFELLEPQIRMDRQIKEISESSNPINIYWKYRREYSMTSAWKVPEEDLKKLYIFEVKASDVGIAPAHSVAAEYFFKKQDYEEMFRRLLLYAKICEKDDLSTIVSQINRAIDKTGPDIPGLQDFIKKMEQQGHRFVLNQNGHYSCQKP